MKTQTSLIIALSLFAATVNAGPTKSAAVERITNYEKQLREHALGAGRENANGLSAQAGKIAKEKMASVYGDKLAEALTVSEKANAKVVEQRLDAVISTSAAEGIGKQLQGAAETKAEGDSIVNSSQALRALISNSEYVRSRSASSTKMTKEEFDLASQTVDRVTEISSNIVKFDTAERDSYTEVVNKYNELLKSKQFLTAEEAMLNAIMQAKGVSREEALRMMRDLVNCRA